MKYATLMSQRCALSASSMLCWPPSVHGVGRAATSRGQVVGATTWTKLRTARGACRECLTSNNSHQGTSMSPGKG